MKGEIKNLLTSDVLAGIVNRQIERRASVAQAHRGNTVWCCASEAEECFDDLESLLREFERVFRVRMIAAEVFKGG